MNTREHVVAMANQIALNFVARDRAGAAEATARHIREFWDPRMRALILEEARTNAPALSAEAKAAALIAADDRAATAGKP